MYGKEFHQTCQGPPSRPALATERRSLRQIAAHRPHLPAEMAGDVRLMRAYPRWSRRQAPNEISRPPGHSKTFATGHRPMKGLDSQSGSRRGQSEVTLSRIDMPWAGHARVRAAAAVAGQDGLPATSAKDKSWLAMSSGPGTWGAIGRHLATPLAPSRPHGRSRRARVRACEIPGGGKGLKLSTLRCEQLNS